MKQTKSEAGTQNFTELKVLLALGGIVILMMIVATIQFRQSPRIPVPVDSALLVREDSPILGPDDASVTLVEFLDPECIACGAAHSNIIALLNDYDGQIRYVVRYFPNHANSTMAIAATEAAGEQGMYWEMQALLFARQSEWIERATPQTDRFMTYAEELGLDMEAFTTDIYNPAYMELSERDLQDARSLNLQGTPVFFVNGRLVYGMQDSVIRDLIDESLKDK
jgi:protein-disulfide isomerase